MQCLDEVGAEYKGQLSLSTDKTVKCWSCSVVCIVAFYLYITILLLLI